MHSSVNRRKVFFLGLFFLASFAILALLLNVSAIKPREKNSNATVKSFKIPETSMWVHFDFDEFKKSRRIENKDDFNCLIRIAELTHKKCPQPWLKTHWLGVPSMQLPADNWLMQEIITEIKPDFIIETGTAFGGTSLFYATVLEKVSKTGRVITIDTNPQVKAASKFKTFRERVEVLQGSSVSPEVVNRIAERVKNSTVLVTLDSNHSKQHVLEELRLYAGFVSLNSYIVVQDTRISVGDDPDNGPLGAVKEFLKTRKDFKVDRKREKFYSTNYQSGFLKRIRRNRDIKTTKEAQ